MKQKNKIKMVIDILMTVLLFFLMAYQVTGNLYHEVLGTAMLVLFLIHNGLNFKWYGAILKGQYSLARVIRTIVNLGVLISILFTGYSGIVMSRDVFAFLPIDGGMATARTLHMVCSYLSFILMSIHLGMHWNMVTGKLKLKKQVGMPAMIFASFLAFYGAYQLGRLSIYNNMFLKNTFAVLDFESDPGMVIINNVAILGMWVYAGYYLMKGIGFLTKPLKSKDEIFKGIGCIGLIIAVVICSIITTPKVESESWGAGQVTQEESVENDNDLSETTEQEESNTSDSEVETPINQAEGFVRITGGTFEMGSPESENWRSPDETLHAVTVSDFYMSAYEVTQEEYESVMGQNPSTFLGENLPLENISWLDAVNYCNARSEQEGLTSVYLIDSDTASGNVTVSWNRGADGYRLPTEAEWEYACRAGTTTPFNTETSISAEESNYYGHYPYEIEGNYFEQDNLTTQPGQYRETTVAVDSFSPNAWGLYNMHGNVSEWVWDYYGTYDTENTTDPTGPVSGNLKVYRGGGWNDFAKNMRSAYRATLEEDLGSFNIGIRLVRNAYSGPEDIVGAAETESQTGSTGAQDGAGNVLIAYFSWGGNTQGVAEEIQAQTGADIFEITLVEPYSSDYNTVLDQAQHDQNIQARPEITEHIDNMDDYDTILIGYPNWWASIPMPIASFLEEYDFSGKTIIPFCSHGGGRFGQSLTAIAKLAPDSAMGEGLSIHYSGGSSLSADVEEWLRTNGIIQ